MIARPRVNVHRDSQNSFRAVSKNFQKILQKILLVTTPNFLWTVLACLLVLVTILVLWLVPPVAVTLDSTPDVFWPFLFTAGMNHVMGEFLHARVGRKLPLMRHIFLASHLPLGIAAVLVTANGLFWFPFCGLMISGLAIRRHLSPS
jgi:hypothetical protein